MNCKKDKTGFTLAEVLITLGIIGVVAALTLPTLIQNQKQKTTITALKKSYSTVQQAYLLALNENGNPENWGMNSDVTKENSDIILAKFAPYLRFTQKCGTDDGCFKGKTMQLNGQAYWEDFDTIKVYSKAILSDGTAIAFLAHGSCTWSAGPADEKKEMCGVIVIDTNGPKSPNQLGTDTFLFYIGKQKIIPYGTPKDDSYSFADFCSDSNAHGASCSAWALYNENLDYLHCDDLSWDGKHSCKDK